MSWPCVLLFLHLIILTSYTSYDIIQLFLLLFYCYLCIHRCIKPNPESRPGSLTPPYVLEQLRAGGVLEAVRIASAGFPTRKAFRYTTHFPNQKSVHESEYRLIGNVVRWYVLKIEIWLSASRTEHGCIWCMLGPMTVAFLCSILSIMVWNQYLDTLYWILTRCFKISFFECILPTRHLHTGDAWCYANIDLNVWCWNVLCHFINSDVLLVMCS